jgi:sialate O-acetylesterase
MNRVQRNLLGFLLGPVALLGPAASAAVTPGGLFTNGAVLQRGVSVPVWGTANDGEPVTVSIQGQTVSTTARNGGWMVRLNPLRAGGPFPRTITGMNRIELRELLVGEVWVCSGQSNMEWPLAKAASGREALAESPDPMLRLFTIGHARSGTPKHTVHSVWKEAGPEAAADFSAVAYFFGRDLRRALKVPVGLIHSSWGGTPAEAWTSRPTLEESAALRSILADYERALERYVDELELYQAALIKRLSPGAKEGADGTPIPPAPLQPRVTRKRHRPAVLYNAMIAPLQPYAIRGVIWYQGEANHRRAFQYQPLFSALIRSWRADWGQGDFPFLFVQLAPFRPDNVGPDDCSWAELREAQRLTSLAIPQTAMAVITDAGAENDIHPRNKEPVGARLALAARAIAYGEPLEYSGPTYDTMKIEGDHVVLRFQHAAGGLVARGGELKGFTVAGEDGKFVEAQAVIQDDRVIVRSPQVPRPVAARYGWANYPIVNLYNNLELPASPFRTDNLPLTTQTPRGRTEKGSQEEP